MHKRYEFKSIPKRRRRRKIERKHMNKIMSEQCTNNDFEEGNTIVDQLNPSNKTPDVGLEPTTLSLEG